MGAASGAFGRGRRGTKVSTKTRQISHRMELYYVPHSPPSRAVLLTIKALALPVTLRKLDMIQRAEHKQVWFLKINPIHTVPALDDNGFTLWESRAIIGYLVQKYAKDDKLYPKEPEQRALVDKMLYFDIGSLYKSITDYWIFGGQPLDSQKANVMKQSLEYLDLFLKDATYAAGSHLTIADLSLVASVTTLDTFDYDYSGCVNIGRWIGVLKTELPNYNECLTNNIEIARMWVKSIVHK